MGGLVKNFSYRNRKFLTELLLIFLQLLQRNPKYKFSQTTGNKKDTATDKPSDEAIETKRKKCIYFDRGYCNCNIRTNVGTHIQTIFVQNTCRA